MLVYLRQPAFLTPAEAIQRWSTSKLDAVVVSEKARAEFGTLLDPFAPNQPLLETAGSQPAYLLLSRPPTSAKQKPSPAPQEGSRRGR